MSEPEDAYDDDTRAAEYVLRLLEDDMERAFEARLANDRDLQSLVQSWEYYLADLAVDIEEVEPPKAVRSRVLASVADRAGHRSWSPIWSWLAGGLVAAGVMVAVVLGGLFDGSDDLTPSFRAELISEDRSVILTAGVIPATHEIVVERVAGAPPAEQIHELWLIADGADAPVSLGLLQNEGTTRIRVPDEIAPGVRTGTIAISIEPPGGSPTGAPTGPVVAAAQFSDL
ncbi:anti-sigma factor [Sulfitobacter aestuariivivens]|uniref:Anti-sigma factor n=1 Tax=Sulfitobacter aestuariivivens TaxID=2766981 RepID=A0A927D3I3_9RHOB|nr:anti-sigma factor [Sulfitobacter aestuariivivens]MBD3662592.1 anti-sigma factor [Sulfitobacter aestuariivivens]